jgi:hypothetical protein
MESHCLDLKKRDLAIGRQPHKRKEMPESHKATLRPASAPERLTLPQALMAFSAAQGKKSMTQQRPC